MISRPDAESKSINRGLLDKILYGIIPAIFGLRYQLGPKGARQFGVKNASKRDLFTIT